MAGNSDRCDASEEFEKCNSNGVVVGSVRHDSRYQKGGQLVDVITSTDVVLYNHHTEISRLVSIHSRVLWPRQNMTHLMAQVHDACDDAAARRPAGRRRRGSVSLTIRHYKRYDIICIRCVVVDRPTSSSSFVAHGRWCRCLPR